ncbi:multiple epidermal growth factor-like domains protein 10 isoform X5 [Biomphalaria glabrata]|uniref:Multiple epidermal growth factor-like domains protein 10 isoform X5 n=1 Tax=Biomphalaria glabrata TaxID=6526 RepID=A0A9W2Z3X0_BIOGL|nr:multiple epidermal growth factor-like domains protein 10 isoform X5 [Biomphalaria glabrata]
MKGPLQIRHIKLIHWTIGLIISMSLDSYQQEDCPDKFFGPECRFKCNFCQQQCSPDGCGKNICVRGYFGYLCQYRDLATHWGAPITIYNDGDVTTCQTNNSVTRASIPMMIMRLSFFIVTIDSSSDANIDDITFEPFQGNSVQQCFSGNYSYKLTSFSKYFKCATINNVTSILLSGKGVSRLCTVTISGGRNLAIKQRYNYSSISRNAEGDKGAVDGEIPLTGSFNPKTCFQAGETSVFSNIYVFMNTLVFIDYLIVYNRPDVINRVKLTGFQLTTYDQANGVLFIFNEGSRPPEGAANYTIFNPWPTNYFAMFKLAQSYKELQFCEVEAWGDCASGDYGLDCTKKCSLKCKDTYCEVSGKCVDCLVGFWAVDCTEACSSGCAGKVCNQEDGNCTQGCEAGFYSPNCTQVCSSGCAGNLCNMEGGDCTQGCLTGYYTPDCSKVCPNCLNDGKCDMDTGHCEEGCKKGYEPPTCENACPVGKYSFDCKENCPENCVDDCSPDEGQCHGRCSNEYFGDSCEKKCPSGMYGLDCSSTCSAHCPLNCTRDEGLCLMCETGYYGQKCEYICNEGCLDNKCHQGNGSCYACGPKYFSSDCSQACSKSCGGSGECDVIDGQCLSGCMDGYHGFYCTEACSGHCKGKMTCNVQDGKCPDGCEKGFVGAECDIECPKNCQNGMCDLLNASCTNGCIPGYGDMNCTTNCTNCMEELCEQVSLNCINGCKKGFIGDDCMSAASTNNNEAEANSSSTSIIVICIALFILITLALAFLLRKKTPVPATIPVE